MAKTEQTKWVKTEAAVEQVDTGDILRCDVCRLDIWSVRRSYPLRATRRTPSITIPLR